MGYNTIYTGTEIIKMIKEAPDVDYVGEYLMGRILGDEKFKVQEEELNKIGRAK